MHFFFFFSKGKNFLPKVTPEKGELRGTNEPKVKVRRGENRV